MNEEHKDLLRKSLLMYLAYSDDLEVENGLAMIKRSDPTGLIIACVMYWHGLNNENLLK